MIDFIVYLAMFMGKLIAIGMVVVIGVYVKRAIFPDYRKPLDP